ncbi:MAG: L,D-transpeptidase [Candidatus Vecturithrix sp.]|nr:L,D-transpeptidase [Candidatus Vecturithrix sp.]
MPRCYCLMVRAMFGLCLLFSLHAVIFHEYSCAQQPILQQLVYLNIPAYNLNLYTQYEDQRWERLSVPIGVGKGAERRSQTPTGQGELYVKATGVTFEYGEQNPAELVGKTITHSNTFDKNTLKPITVKMPNDMKSIFMRINSDIDAQFHTRFVLHETTDWYTVGTPASNGCIRLDREDMQRLYAALAPSVSEGYLPQSVPITIYYDVAEYSPEQQMMVLHANIYNRSIDYVHEILHDLQEAGIDTRSMNMPVLLEVVNQAEQQFQQALHMIQNRLAKAPFDRLILDHEKQLLHFTFYLRFQY